MRVGIDTGGTFTDAVVVASEPDGTARVGLGKALSTPGDLTVGALASVEAAAADLERPLGEVLRQARSPVDQRTPWPSARPGADRFEIRRLYCPACAVQVDVQVALAEAPLLDTAELL